ncbi:dihydroxyacetone kinase subunit DhaL [Methylogaea oryzae]|uniref:dihydroxyacetone kinase subunit DhaL n=1 Tax=Methylogaea oryzae TaxID=1295382 RepID=UPI000AB4DFD8|nr:dihydroxyacetone kinase subunit DhaL [Methylogaea oryzae]
MTTSAALIPDFIRAVGAVIRDNAEEVTALDQAIGDGDHVTNLQRGLEALDGLAASLGEDWSAALQKIGMSLMSSVGGASGSLYGTLFLAMSKSLKGKELDQASLAEAFAQGVEAMKQRGKAGLGEKTMLDVLIPVANALQEASAASLPLPQLLENVEKVAAAGAESTRDLVATKGRASFLASGPRAAWTPAPAPAS